MRSMSGPRSSGLLSSIGFVAPIAYTPLPPDAPLIVSTRAPELMTFTGDSASYEVAVNSVRFSGRPALVLGRTLADAETGAPLGGCDAGADGDGLAGTPPESTGGTTGRPGSNAPPGGGSPSPVGWRFHTSLNTSPSAAASANA